MIPKNKLNNLESELSDIRIRFVTKEYYLVKSHKMIQDGCSHLKHFNTLNEAEQHLEVIQKRYNNDYKIFKVTIEEVLNILDCLNKGRKQT